MGRKKNIVNQCKTYGTQHYGKELLYNSIYGTTYFGQVWVVDDFNFYPDNKSIDVWLYNDVKKRWLRKPISSGYIYEIAVDYIVAHNLWGIECKRALRVSHTFQSCSPTGKKEKMTCLKQVNKQHWNRGNKPGVVLGYNGSPYTRGNFMDAHTFKKSVIV